MAPSEAARTEECSLTTPGWYPVPEDPASVRYFDGARWTEDRHPSGAVPAYRAEPVAAQVTSHRATAPYRPAAYPAPAPALDPPPATEYLRATRDDDWRP